MYGLRDELTAPPRSAFLSGPNRPPVWTVEHGERLLDPVVGPLLSLEEASVPGPSRCVRSLIQRTDEFSDGGWATRERLGSTALDIKRARAGAVGEAVERYSLSVYRYNDMRTAVYDEIAASACPPTAFTQGRGQAKQERSVQEEKHRWIATRSLVTNNRVLIPAQCVYVPFSADVSICESSSLGAAAGPTRAFACEGAVHELVERECFAIGYLAKLEFPRLDFTAATGGVARLHGALEANFPEVHVLDATLDHPFATYIVLVIDPDRSPVVTVGLGCHANPRAALREALLEATQSATQGVFAEGIQSLRGSGRSLKERADVWTESAALSALDHWRKSDETVEPPTTGSVPRERALREFIQYLEANGLDCLITDVTSPDLAVTGLHAVRAVVPAFHQPSLVDTAPSSTGERLYQLPVTTGYLSESPRASDLNDVPHPFL